jgi:glutathione S-transferase
MPLAILYSFRRCPYAMRARMALIASGISIEIREVELRNKPKAMLTASPKGSVPVLVLPDGRVIDESWDIMLWALRQNDPQNWLGDHENNLPAALCLLEENDTIFKRNLDRYKYPKRFPEHPQDFYRAQGAVFLQKLEAHLRATPYLLNNTMSIADAAVLPFVRQFAAVDAHWFASAPYPELRDWLKNFIASELFTVVMQKHPVWQATSH